LTDAFVADAQISEVTHPSSRALGSCKTRATISGGSRGSTRVCIERLIVGRQLLDFSPANDVEHAVVVHGRRAWTGAVIDSIREQDKQANKRP
jgi:hypothetical protein